MSDTNNELGTDAQKAAAYRIELAAHLALVCNVLNRARKDDLVVSFQIGPDQYGQSSVQNIGVVKPL